MIETLSAGALISPTPRARVTVTHSTQIRQTVLPFSWWDPSVIHSTANPAQSKNPSAIVWQRFRIWGNSQCFRVSSAASGLRIVYIWAKTSSSMCCPVSTVRLATWDARMELELRNNFNLSAGDKLNKAEKLYLFQKITDGFRRFNFSHCDPAPILSTHTFYLH